MAVTIGVIPTPTGLKRYYVADTAAELPTAAPAADGDLGYAKDTDSGYTFNGVAWAQPTATAAWGGITGTLADQTDLQTALDAKQAASVLAMTKNAPTANATVTAGYTAYAAGSYECVDQITTEIGLAGTLEIG